MATTCLSCGRSTRMALQSTSGYPAVCQREKNKTAQNKIKQSQSDREDWLSNLTMSPTLRGQSAAGYAGSLAVQLNGPLKELSWPWSCKNSPRPHLTSHPPLPIPCPKAGQPPGTDTFLSSLPSTSPWTLLYFKDCFPSSHHDTQAPCRQFSML